MFEITANDPLSQVIPEQPWAPDQGLAPWLQPADTTDSLDDWLFGMQSKEDLDSFGPMFNPAEDEEATELDEIVVTGERLERLPTSVQVTIGDVSEPPTNGGGGGGQPPETDDCPGGPAPDGPTPAGLDISDIRKKAQEAVDLIKDQRRDWEWGVITYLLNGELHNTPLSTMQSNIEIGFNYTNPSIIPTGAHIVAWTHSHTDARGVFDQSRLSNEDDDARQVMLDNANGRFTVDPNLMTYVHDNRANQTREFNENDRAGSSGQRVTSCS